MPKITACANQLFIILRKDPCRAKEKSLIELTVWEVQGSDSDVLLSSDDFLIGRVTRQYLVSHGMVTE